MAPSSGPPSCAPSSNCSLTASPSFCSPIPPAGTVCAHTLPRRDRRGDVDALPRLVEVPPRRCREHPPPVDRRAVALDLHCTVLSHRAPPAELEAVTALLRNGMRLAEPLQTR